jgi:hypothetical protein
MSGPSERGEIPGTNADIGTNSAPGLVPFARFGGAVESVSPVSASAVPVLEASILGVSVL